MADDNTGAFWSYAHDDDKHEDGAICRLAGRIQEEYSLITGDAIELFVDRTDIGWGEEWKARIKNALVTTTFFIPIVTPRYFTREECRQELFEFARHAESLGVADLICPILYVPVSGLSTDSPDEAMALVARAQWEDWTELRLADDRSAEYRRAVNRLAIRLAEVATTVDGRQTALEAPLTSEDESAALDTTLQAIREALPDWLAATEEDGLVREQFFATDVMLEERKRKLKNAPAGARYLVLRQQVAEYTPLIERRMELASRLLRETVTLSPLVTTALRIVTTHPESAAGIGELVDAVQRANDAYRKFDRPLEPLAAWARRHAHETRGMLHLARLCERHDSLRKEIGSALRSWTADVKALPAAPSPAVFAAPAAAETVPVGRPDRVAGESSSA